MFDSPPPMPPAAAPPADLCGLLNLIRQETEMLERGMAGYDTMTTLYSQIAHGAPANGRKKGMPIVNYKGTINGINAVDVAVDLSKLPAECLPAILGPFANQHAHTMLDSATRIYQAVGTILKDIQAAMQPVVQQNQPPLAPQPHLRDEDGRDFNDPARHAN